MIHKHVFKEIFFRVSVRMSFPSSRFEAGEDGRWRAMKHPANGAKLVRGALLSDNKAHRGKENTHGWQPISLQQ